MPEFREPADALISGGPFQGFRDEDFAAYEQGKWSSNAFTLPRRQAKDKLLALARATQVNIEELQPLELHGSDEAPTVANGKKVDSQRAYFLRDSDARAALKPLLQTTNLQSLAGLFDIALESQHVSLALRLDVTGLAFGVEIGSKAKVDRDNARGKLAHSWGREKLLEIAQTLPEGTELGVGEDLVPATEASGDDVERWRNDLGRGEVVFRARLTVPREESALRDAAFVGDAVEFLSAFVPLYHFLAWTRDNDHAQLKETLKKSEEERKKKASTYKPGDRVTVLSGWLAGQGATILETDLKSGKAKAMVGAVTVTVDMKDLKPL